MPDPPSPPSSASRVVMKKNDDGGTSLVIQFNNDDKDKTESVRSALKTLSAANDREEELKAMKEHDAKRILTPLMRLARDDKEGNEIQKEIRAAKKAGTLNEREKDLLEEKDNTLVDGGDDSGKEIDNAEGGEDSGKEVDNAKKSSDILPKEGGWAAIHFACDSGNHEGLSCLIEAGADPNLTEERMGATPLHRVILGAGKYPMMQLQSRSGGKSGEKGNVDGNKSAASGSGVYGSKMALPDVITSKSGATASADKKEGGQIDSSYLDDYMKCLKLCLDAEKFNLMVNERREDEFRASEKSPQSLDNMTLSEKIKVRKAGLPEDDGFGISPLCLCVSQAYASRDALYPLLEHLLTRGFDPNATMCGVSALHIALRNAHYGCAFALTRAGANINAVHPDGRTALAAASVIYGESFARELREASVVAMAVADPTRRRDLLRSQGQDGAKKIAKRAMNAGHSFAKASRWREAGGAYSEAAAYGSKSLPMRERFECLMKMSECFLKVERGLKSKEVARQLLQEFPKVPLAMVLVGEAMTHPSAGKLKKEQIEEVNKLADEALKLEKNSNQKEWWRTLEPANRGNSSLIRALKLKGLVEGYSSEKNQAVKVANTALDEYFTPGGSIEKAAFAIELALKPELNHPSPLPLHGIRGFIYYSWASEILRANSLCRSDRERKDGLLRVMAPLKNPASYKEAQEKIRIASEEFEYYSVHNVKGEFPRLMYGFNISKTCFALGKFEEGKCSALASIKERAESDLDRLDDGNSRKTGEATQEEHLEGGSTQKLILQLNWALDMNRMLITQMVVDYAINADSKSSTSMPSSILLDPTVKGLTLKDDVINMPHLCLVLEKAVQYKLLDKASEKKLLDKISGNPLKVNAAIKGLLSAIRTLESGHQAMSDLRVEVGKVIMNFIAAAHRMQKQTKSSTRVVGSLLMEAMEWDKNVQIPPELPKMYVKMAQELTQTPS